MCKKTTYKNCIVCGVRTKSKKCSTCYGREWDKKNPIKRAYINLKKNAKRRGKVFNISFEYFKKFCIKTEYHKKKGISRNCYHIDRIDEEKGYIEGNIRLLTNIENIKKYHALTNFNYWWNDEEKRMEYNTKTEIVEYEFNDVPF